MILNQLFENSRAPSGSAYDRGGADAWYHRGRHPHKIVDGREVALTDPQEIADYNRGYDDEGIEGRHQGKQYDVREQKTRSGLGHHIPNRIDPKLVQILKKRGYKGPYQLGKLTKWYRSLRYLPGEANDEIMVTGPDVKYDAWVLNIGIGYAFGQEMGYMTGDERSVIKNT